MTFEEGSLCEPLAVALAGLEKANVKLGDPIAIWYVLSLDYYPTCTNHTPYQFTHLTPHTHLNVID